VLRLRGVLIGFGQGCRSPTRRWRAPWLADTSCGVVIAKRFSVVQVVRETEFPPLDSYDDEDRDANYEDDSYGSRKHCLNESA
jgi:hypothetical protein